MFRPTYGTPTDVDQETIDHFKAAANDAVARAVATFDFGDRAERAAADPYHFEGGPDTPEDRAILRQKINEALADLDVPRHDQAAELDDIERQAELAAKESYRRVYEAAGSEKTRNGRTARKILGICGDLMLNAGSALRRRFEDEKAVCSKRQHEERQARAIEALRAAGELPIPVAKIEGDLRRNYREMLGESVHCHIRREIDDYRGMIDVKVEARIFEGPEGQPASTPAATWSVSTRTRSRVKAVAAMVALLRAKGVCR